MDWQGLKDFVKPSRRKVIGVLLIFVADIALVPALSLFIPSAFFISPSSFTIPCNPPRINFGSFIALRQPITSVYIEYYLYVFTGLYLFLNAGYVAVMIAARFACVAEWLGFVASIISIIVNIAYWYLLSCLLISVMNRNIKRRIVVNAS